MKWDWNRILDQWPAKVLALTAALLLFMFHRFDALQTRSLTIPLRVVTDTSYVPAEDYPQRVRVIMRGTADSLSGISEADLEAWVDFSGHQGEGIFREPIRVERHSGSSDSVGVELSVDPLTLKLHLEKKIVKTVPIRPDFEGQPARNFELSGFQVSPSVITVEGPRTVVESVDSVDTEAIELRGKTDTFSIKARVLSHSPLVGFPFGNTVDVQGIMSSSLASLVLENVQPQIVNLTPGLVLKSPLPSVKVRLRGTREALQKLNKDALGAPTLPVTADLSGITTPGNVPEIPLNVHLPDGVELVELTPAVVNLILVAPPLASPP